MRTCGTTTLPVTSGRARERASGAGTPFVALTPRLRGLVRALRRRGVDSELGVAGSARDVRPEAAEALVRAVAAAAGDAVRHGRARVVTLRVTYAAGSVEVVVRDDGAGPAARPGGAFAARLARRRLEELGGGLEIASGRRAGSVVRAWVR